VKRPALLLAILLCFLAAGLMTYRILKLGYPLFPMAQGQVWQVVIEADIEPGQGESQLSLGLPLPRRGNVLLEESVTSGSYSFNLLRQGSNRVGAWSGDGGDERQGFRYRAVVVSGPKRISPEQPPREGDYTLKIAKEELTALTIFFASWKNGTPKLRLEKILDLFKREKEFSSPSSPAVQKWAEVEKRYGRSESLLALLAAVGLTGRPVKGLRLEEGIQTQPTHWIEIWLGKTWEALNPETGERIKNPAQLLPLAVGDLPVVKPTNAKLTELRWIVNRQVVRQWKLLFERIVRSNHWLNRWSLFHLPDNFQQTFRILLLVPIGALMISILRNIFGFPTFGIFMPVLMALAFRSTGLLFGIGMFAGILLVGYLARRILDRLHLLLVPRMSVMLTLVICCFTFLALLGNKLGQKEFMAVGLIPFVILTMTIERFFVVIEEDGLRKALMTSAGSTAVSVIAYLVLNWERLQIFFFVYPELMLGVAALQVLIGRYTGYRLSELFRFRNLRKAS
jgi:hypothetical protein